MSVDEMPQKSVPEQPAVLDVDVVERDALEAIDIPESLEAVQLGRC